MYSDTESSFSVNTLSHRRIESKAPRWTSESQVDENAFLSMREEYMRMKRKEQEDHQKMRELAAQLARTEEAAKRLMVRSDRSARGGTAARLLAAEKELSCITASAVETRSKLRDFARSNRELKGKNAELKGRLEGALRDQRHLVMQVGKAERQRSRFGLTSNARIWHALAAQPGSKGSSAQPDQSQLPSRPDSASPQASAPVSEPLRQQTVPPLSSRALRKLKRLSLSRSASPRSGAESIRSADGGASPLLSLEQQVQEALRRAEDLQRQMSAMQACGLAQLGSPQQHAADAFPDGCQPASDRHRSTEDARRAAQPCPETASVSQSSPGCAVIPESEHGSHGGAEAAEPQLQQEAAHCSQNGAMPPAGGSASGRCSERSGKGDGMAPPAAMSPTSAAHCSPSPASAEAQAPAHVQPSAIAMCNGHCFWRRICPGSEGWPDPDRWLTVALHAVRLHPRVARQQQRQRLFLMYSFLPELCPAEAQCTHCLPATDTLLTFQHVQAYDICGERDSSQSVHQSAGDVTAMGSGDAQTIPVCLVRQSRNLEKEEHEQIAVCRINLMDGDRLHACIVLHDGDGAEAATLTISMTGSACMCSTG
ncbi:hypothetical protein CVIRNUC_000394 [Coccomyxa viridis]|uniref:Uncharacterized protein n=1 Tax=Coccomyxa viridis TaxID=1274662 RepID=A0AAV1HTN6_9CHLO|nr:hypothetical protein CVIRNUC_000394 [Coccomyxa viridis]